MSNLKVLEISQIHIERTDQVTLIETTPTLCSIVRPNIWQMNGGRYYGRLRLTKSSEIQDIV